MRHAGFAVVVSATESSLNALLQQSFSLGGPFYFPLPQTVTVGGTQVALGGIALAACPTVEVRAAGPTVRFAFFSTCNARVAGASQSQRWKVRLDVTVNASFVLGPVNNFITLQLDTSTVTFGPLTVTFLQGPPPPPPVMAALQSQAVANAATAVVRRMPNLQLAQLCPANLVHTESYTYPKTGLSVFDWFTISFTVSRVFIRYFDGAVTIAADFAGVTNGNPAALVDLTAQQTHTIYTEVYNDKAVELQAPHFVERSQSTLFPGLSVLVNIEVVKSMMRQMSAQTVGTPLTDRVNLISVSADYAEFKKPLRGWEDGLHLRAKVRVGGSTWVDVFTFMENEAQADIYLQPFVEVYDGWKSEYQGDPKWQVYVARVDVSTTMLMDIAIAAAQVLEVFLFTIVTMPALILNYQLLFKSLQELGEDINRAFAKADTENAANKVQRQLQGSLYDADLPQDAAFVSVTPDGLETGWAGGRFLANYTPAIPVGGATIRPTSWPATARQPIVTSVELDKAWQGLNRASLKATWEVRRADTNEVVVVGIKPYNSPAGNGVSINHHSEQLYLVDEFRVRCTLTLIAGDTVGEIWSDVATLRIEDKLDRRQSFVEWGPKWVRFHNAGTNGAMWSRYSRSRIHRTAVAARCRALWIATTLGLPKGTRFHYFDYLPWGWEGVPFHRTELCEYCFFGGPDKTVPYPAFDWFEPNAGLAYHQTMATQAASGTEFFERHFG